MTPADVVAQALDCLVQWLPDYSDPDSTGRQYRIVHTGMGDSSVRMRFTPTDDPGAPPQEFHIVVGVIEQAVI
jgi:hypothetical protein